MTGRAAVLLASLVASLVLAADANAYVYWSTGTTVGRANLDGSGAQTFLSGTYTATGVAVDGSYIYWGDGSAIARANLNGSDPQPAWLPTSSGEPSGIATDGSYIYWVTGSSTIYRANLDGTHTISLVSNAGADVDSLVVLGGTIYYAYGTSIKDVPAAGGAPQNAIVLTPIEPSDPAPDAFGIAATGGFLYWSELTLGVGIDFGDIGRAPLNDLSNADETFIEGLTEPGPVATDGTYIYWADDGTNPVQIGRVPIAAPSSVTADFESVSGMINGLAADAAIDPTATTVTCTPTVLSIGQPSSCTATVGDASSSAPPTGTVNFTGSAALFFSGNPCTLAPKAGGGASCTVGADLTTPGAQTITATYAGDTVHHSSGGTASLCEGTASQCGGKPPPPPAKPNCVVPKLKGKTLAQARTLLAKAHCKLGKVTKPKVKKHHKQPSLVVSSTKPGAGTKLTNGAKVAVKLVAAPKKKHDRR